MPDVLWILITLTLGVACVYDWHSRSVPLWVLLVLLALGVCKAMFIAHPSFLGVGLLFLIGVAFAYKKYVGWGDGMFFIFSSLVLSWEQIPLFLLSSGIIGLLTAALYSRKNKASLEFPLIPALSLALIISTLMAPTKL